MGLFDKLFNKKEKVSPAHEEDWDFYFCNVEDIIGSFFVDLGLKQIAAQNDKPNLVWVSLKMNNPKPDGLSSEEEFDRLSAIEDRLQEFLSNKHKTLYAGRLTTNGYRNYYFYLGDPILHDKTISEALVAYPDYSYDFGMNEDENWKTYFEFLYPDPRQYQSIQNRKVVDNLEKGGDPLTKARPVDHWIYFKTENDRNTFLSKIKDLNFSIVDQRKINSRDGHPYSLQISRIDLVDYNSVDDYTLLLWELATESDGDYDGWETSIEKSGSV
jgi:uncharacterized protein (TIGR01619 family)